MLASLIEIVAKLKELEAKATPGPYEAIERINEWEIYRPCLPIAGVTRKENAEMLVAMRNDAPMLLDVLP